jgi:hypothetical protein
MERSRWLLERPGLLAGSTRSDGARRPRMERRPTDRPGSSCYCYTDTRVRSCDILADWARQASGSVTASRPSGRYAVGLRPSLDPASSPTRPPGRGQEKGQPTLLTGPSPSGMTCTNTAAGSICLLLRLDPSGAPRPNIGGICAALPALATPLSDVASRRGLRPALRAIRKGAAPNSSWSRSAGWTGNTLGSDRQREGT